MNITIKNTGIDLSSSVTDHVYKRLEKISKLMRNDSAALCHVELARSTGHHAKGDVFRAEIHITGSRKDCYASSEKEDLYSAIDDVRNEILRELKANREKQISFVRRGGARVKLMMKGLWSFKGKGE